MINNVIYDQCTDVKINIYFSGFQKETVWFGQNKKNLPHLIDR